MRDAYGQRQSAAGLRHRLEAMSPLHRIERYQDRLLQDKRILTNRMEQVLKEQKIKVQGLSEALLMLDTSRIIARGYAMVKEGDQVLDSVAKSNRRGPAVTHHERWPVKVEVKHVERKKFEENLADLGSHRPKCGEWDVALEETITEFKRNEVVKRIARYLGSSRKPWSRSCRQMVLKRI